MVTHGSTTCTLLEAQDDANANYYATVLKVYTSEARPSQAGHPSKPTHSARRPSIHQRPEWVRNGHADSERPCRQ